MLRPIIFGKLCLLERISVGGMAEVYRAKPFNVADVDRYLAVKRILPNLAEDDEFISMFVDEAKIAIRLNHDNICQIYELGRLAGAPYIVMEYIAGQDVLNIQKRLRQRRRVMAVGQAVYIASRIASALHHSHVQTDDDGVPLEIVHRDVSPQNVLISYAGEVKLIDFGIAKVATQSTETRVGVLKGKFSYMSPEQVRGHVIDCRSDLFALGTVLYEMLTGRRLFHGESDFHTLEQVREARVAAPSTLNKLVPPELDEIVLKCLAREPDDRYPDGDTMSAALQGFLDGAGSPFAKEELSAWMVEHFAAELDAERRAREDFKQFVTPEDVRDHNREQIERLKASLGAPQEGNDTPLSGSAIALGDSDIELIEDPEEIIAENIVEPLPTRIAYQIAHASLPNIDLPEPVEADHDSHFFRPQEERKRHALTIALLAVAVLALAAVGLSQLFKPRTPPPLTGGIQLETIPGSGIQVFLDGALVSESSPVVLRSIQPGNHWIEVRHPDFEAVTQEVSVSAGSAPRLQVRLEPLPNDPGSIVLRVTPPDAEVWLNGDFLGRELAEFELTSRQVHLIEVVDDGYFVSERRVTLSPAEQRTLDVELVAVSGTLEVTTNTESTVFVDDQVLDAPEGAPALAELDPHVAHRLRVEPLSAGFRPVERTVVFEAVTHLTEMVRLRRFGEPAREDAPDVGFLAVATPDDWYRVMLDGRDTGLTTPISTEQPMALRIGDRRVSLVRGDDRYDILIPVYPGQTTVVDCGRPEWDCGVP